MSKTVCSSLVNWQSSLLYPHWELLLVEDDDALGRGIRLALEGGGLDNITVLLMQVEAVEENNG